MIIIIIILLCENCLATSSPPILEAISFLTSCFLADIANKGATLEQRARRCELKQELGCVL